MTLSIAFWVLMFIWLLFGVWRSWPNVQTGGGDLILFVLLVLLGWRTFGAPIKGG